MGRQLDSQPSEPSYLLSTCSILAALPVICSSSWAWLQQDLCSDHWHDKIFIFGPQLISHSCCSANTYLDLTDFWELDVLSDQVKQFLSMSQPVLFIGESGTAKSAALLKSACRGLVTIFFQIRLSCSLTGLYPSFSHLDFRSPCRILWRAIRQTRLSFWTSTTPPEQARAFESTSITCLSC